MIDILLEKYNVLVDIRKYLIKKGQSRYKGQVIETKLGEAKTIFDECGKILLLLEKGKDVKLVASALDIYQKIKIIYEEINSLCIFPKINSDKMEFDLKVACSLLPVMDGVEGTTKRLIDSIEMYGDMLDAKGKTLLIIFILKSRLSENAKLRITGNYMTIQDLIKDMKCHLLTQKSFIAIQTRLQNIQQGSSTIEEFGTEVEKLFTELTISQSDGNSNAFGVLKPLNEKLAIKRFSEGLRSSKLGTVISARNYSSLKDAIQAAKDEDTSGQSSSGNVLHAFRNGRGSNNLRRQGTRYFNNNRGQYTNSYSRGRYGNYNNQRNMWRSNFRGYNGNRYNNGNKSNYQASSNYNRGQRKTRGSRYFRNGNRNICLAEQDDNNKPGTSDNTDTKKESENQFFRS